MHQEIVSSMNTLFLEMRFLLLCKWNVIPTSVFCVSFVALLCFCNEALHVVLLVQCKPKTQILQQENYY